MRQNRATSGEPEASTKTGSDACFGGPAAAGRRCLGTDDGVDAIGNTQQGSRHQVEGMIGPTNRGTDLRKGAALRAVLCVRLVLVFA
jgi:hypothetical protein